MDINQLYTAQAHEEGAEMQIRAPDGKFVDAWIKLVGVDSKTYRGVTKEAELAAALLRIDKSKVNDEELSEPYLYAKTILDWRGLQNGEQELKFSKEKALELLKEAPYILDQIKRFQANRGNFIKG